MNDEERNDKGLFTPANSYKWKPGESGNPNGRPRGSKNGSAALRRLARQFIDPKTGLSLEEQIGAKLIAKALEGDLKAIALFYERTEGRAGVRNEREMEIIDWRERVQMYGLDEKDVIEQAKLLLESANGSGSSTVDR
jgi:hypothetical protein